jgi:hypothetical protein
VFSIFFWTCRASFFRCFRGVLIFFHRDPLTASSFRFARQPLHSTNMSFLPPPPVLPALPRSRIRALSDPLAGRYHCCPPIESQIQIFLSRPMRDLISSEADSVGALPPPSCAYRSPSTEAAASGSDPRFVSLDGDGRRLPFRVRLGCGRCSRSANVCRTLQPASALNT